MTRNDAGNRYLNPLDATPPILDPDLEKNINELSRRSDELSRSILLTQVIMAKFGNNLWKSMAKTCSEGKEFEERVAAVSSHPINAVNADHNAALAHTNMANVSWRLWTESGPRGVAEGRGGGGSGMQDTVKLPAESPIPVWVDGWNGLCPLRALGPPSNRVFVLSPCL